MTRTMLLETDVDTVLDCLLLAMQAKNLIKPSSMATSSQNNRGTKLRWLALQQQDLSWHMAHQDGYEDWEEQDEQKPKIDMTV